MTNQRNAQHNPSDEHPCHNHSGHQQRNDDPHDGTGFGHGQGHDGKSVGGGHGEGRRSHTSSGESFDPRDDSPEDVGRGRGGPGHGHGHGRGLGPRGARRAGRGDVRLAIMTLLSEAPSKGYGLMTAISDRTKSAWRPSPGSVYPTLQQLADEELIVASSDGKGTEYQLTEAGRTFVQDNDSAIQRVWAATPGRNDSEVAFHQSVTKLEGVTHQFRLAATDEQRAAATQTLDEARRALYLILAD